MRRRRASAAVFAGAASGLVLAIAGGAGFAACGGATSPTVATDAAVVDAPITTACPSAAPEPGARCTVDALGCSFGDAPLAECRDAWRCTDATWKRTTEWGLCPDADAGACPGAPPLAGDAGAPTCERDGLKCAFAGGTICRCAACSAGPCAPPPPRWSCAPPPADPGCAATVPNDGAPCTTAGARCFYGGAGACGLVASCESQRWRWLPQPCPVSGARSLPIPPGATRPGTGP